jgi:Domain of unknown function (DUF4367)
MRKMKLWWMAFLILVSALAACSSKQEETGEPFSGQLIPPIATLKPPSGTLTPEMQTATTLDEAQAQVHFTLLVPEASTLPAGMKFEDAKILTANKRQAVNLEYEGQNDQAMNVQEIDLEGPLGQPGGAYETVQLRGTQAYLVTETDGKTLAIAWEENGRAISVGGNLDRQSLLAIANGLAPYAKSQ